MDIRERVKRSFKLRFAILYPFGLLAILFSHPSDRVFLVSAMFIALGLLIRVWSNAYAIKMDKLTTCGPYAYVRNPLYLGTILIVTGFAFMFDIVYLGALFLSITIIVYLRTIKKEEGMLEAKFKDLYLGYRKKVPALFPTIWPYRQGEKWAFNFKRLIESKEYKPVIWVIVFLIILYIKNKIIFGQATLGIKLWSLVGVAALLGMVDIMGEVIKRKRSRAASAIKP